MGSEIKKWKEALVGITGAEAFHLINDPKRKLTTEQRNILWKYWEDNRHKKYLNPEWWAKEDD